MAAPIPLRSDHDGPAFRRLAISGLVIAGSSIIPELILHPRLMP